MAIPKVISAIHSLSPSGRRRFDKFVRSPYFNTRTKLLAVHKYIDGLQNEDDWDPAKAYTAVFHKAGYAPLPLNNVLSDLYKLLERFLRIEAIEQAEDLKHAAEVNGILNISAPSVTKAYLRKKEKQQIQDAFGKYQLYKLYDQYHFQQTRKNNNADLVASQKNFTAHFLQQQLRTWCELLNRNNILSLDFDNRELVKFKTVLRQFEEDLQSNPTVFLYYSIFRWLNNPTDDNWYIGFPEKLIAHMDDLSGNNAREICAYVQNYCVKRINEGREEFLRELFNLFRLMIEKNLITDNNTLSQWTYKNIVTTGLRLREFAETEQFIHDWYIKLPEAVRDNAYQYNLAVLHYESGQYKRAMQLLTKVHFTDPNYYLDAKCILLKIYFEQEAYEAIHSLKDTVKIYLIREKLLSKSQKQLYKNLFNYTLKLYRLKYESAYLPEEKVQGALQKLSSEIQKNALIANKAWLLRELDTI